MLSFKNRLKKKKEIDAVFQKGKSSFDRIVGVKAAPNQLDRSRFAVIVGVKNAKKATQRNYIKRRLRNAAISRLALLKPGYDIVMIAGPDALIADFADVEKALARHFSRLQLITKKN